MKNNRLAENLFFILPLVVLILIYCAVLSPIYVWLCSDIIYLESYLPGVLEVLLELCQLFIWGVLFSNMIKAIRVQRKALFILTTVIVLLVRYFYPIVFELIKGSPLDPINIIDALIYYGADILILSIAFVIILSKKESSKKKFMQFSALISAILISVSKVASRFIFDIFYGAPESLSEILFMFAYYFFDIVFGVISYFLIYFITKLLLTEKNSD